MSKAEKHLKDYTIRPLDYKCVILEQAETAIKIAKYEGMLFIMDTDQNSGKHKHSIEAIKAEIKKLTP